jgi:hypothetical protein
MDVMLLRLFQQHVREQCEAVLIAYGEMDPNSPRFWYAVQVLVSAAANLSKAFWGQGGKLSKQREVLRLSVGVADFSPLLLTDMRNNFEHIDDRLDTWFYTSPRHNHADRIIGDRTTAIVGMDEIDLFRSYDPSTGILRF